MATTQKKTIGISLAIEAASTGAISNFHKITGFYFDFNTRMVQATVMSYVSQSAVAAGKQPIGNATASFTIGENDFPSEEMLYQLIVTPQQVNAQNPGLINIFAGATLVTE